MALYLVLKTEDDGSETLLGVSTDPDAKDVLKRWAEQEIATYQRENKSPDRDLCVKHLSRLAGRCKTLLAG